MEQLTALDASFVYRELPHAPLHVGTVLLYDATTAPGGTLTFDDVVSAVSRRLHLAKAFRRRLVPVPMELDHPWWIEDAGFDLTHHVKRASLPRPGGREGLFALAAELFARPLDLARPPWEMHVVDDVGEGQVAVVQKIHHAAVDGLAGMEILGAIHDRSPDASPPAPGHEWEPERVPPPWELVARANVHAVSRPLHGADVLRRVLPRLTAASGRSADADPTALPPPTRFNGPILSSRVVVGRELELSALRRARSLVPGSSVNDVVLAVVGGALRRHLGGDLPAAPLVAMVPLSVRRKGDRGAGGNRVTTMSISLATDLAAPVDRLDAIHGATKRAKETASAVGARELVEYSETMPGGLVALAARASSMLAAAPGAGSHSCVVTNVPGPRSPIYLAGARLQSIHGLTPPADGLGLTHTIVTYCGTVAIGVVSTPRALPDPQAYGDALVDAAEELAGAVR